MTTTGSIWEGFYDVVVVPPLEVTSHVIALSEALHKHGTPWKLGLEERRPHLSLYHLALNSKHSPEDVARALEGRIMGGTIELTDVSSPRHGAVFLNTTCPEWLRTGAHQVSMILRSPSEQLAIEDPRFMERYWQVELSEQMLEDIKRWGSPFMGKGFIPHFTLGSLQDHDKAKRLAESMRIKQLRWKVEKFEIVQVGDGWTAGATVAEFPAAK